MDDGGTYRLSRGVEHPREFALWKFFFFGTLDRAEFLAFNYS